MAATLKPSKRSARKEKLTTMKRFMLAGNVTPMMLEKRSGIGRDTINRLSAWPEANAATLNGQIGTICRISVAMGVAPCDLWPFLARRPSTGLLLERGVVIDEMRATVHLQTVLNAPRGEREGTEGTK